MLGIYTVHIYIHIYRDGSRIFKKGVHYRSTSKKKGGGVLEGAQY